MADSSTIAVLALDPAVDAEQLSEWPITWIDVLREGQFVYRGAELPISRDVLHALAGYVNSTMQPIPLDGAGLSDVHEMPKNTGAPAAGWALRAAVVLGGDGRAHLWVMVRLHPVAAQRIEHGEVLYASATLARVEDPEGRGEVLALHSVALTNKPHIPGLVAHQLGRERPDGVVELGEVPGERLIALSEATEEPMAEKKDKVVHDGMDADTGQADGRQEQHSPPPVVGGEVLAQLAELRQELAELRASILKERAAAELNALEAAGVKLSDKQRDSMLALSVTSQDAFQAALSALRPSPPEGTVLGESANAKASRGGPKDVDEAYRMVLAELSDKAGNDDPGTMCLTAAHVVAERYPELIEEV